VPRQTFRQWLSEDEESNNWRLNGWVGKCQSCGYSRCEGALDFHHKDERQKSFGISTKGYTRSWKAVRDEVSKCYLLCANCHRETHAGVLQLSAEKRIGKQGELSRKGSRKALGNVGQEALAKNEKSQGNLQPSPAKNGEGSETKRLAPKREDVGDEIVHATMKIVD